MVAKEANSHLKGVGIHDIAEAEALPCPPRVIGLPCYASHVIIFLRGARDHGGYMANGYTDEGEAKRASIYIYIYIYI